MPEIPANYRRLKGSERRPAPGFRRIGPADPGETLSVTIRVRRRPDAQPLPDQADWAATPPGQRKYLLRDDFAQRYGASPADLELVERFATDHHLKVIESNTARRIVILSGTVEQMNSAFAVDLGRYESPTERYRGRECRIHLPPEIADVVEGVFGLDNRRTAGRATDGGVITTAITNLTPQQVAQLYNFPKVPANIGQETIGLLAFSDPNPAIGTCGYKLSDIQAYFTTNTGIGPGYVTPNLTDVCVNGAANTPSNGKADGEVALDIEVAGAVAQGAKIAVYFTTWDENGWVLAVNRAVHPNPGDPAPSVLSISWGWSECRTVGNLSWTQAAIDAVSATLRDAASIGMTILVASGDDGSNCRVDDGDAHVNYPASDPWVISCGGTAIEGVSGSSFKEVMWNNNGITGGGISDAFPLPSWQTGAGVPTSVNPGHRQGRGIPDVAGYANGYSIVAAEKNQGPFPGTSETAPLYAGLIAIINATLKRRVGYLNPALYALGRTKVFRDIDDGKSNSAKGAPGYTTGQGWDACTGWGSIDGGALLAALQK